MRCNELFHKDDAEFDFVKSKQGKLFVDRGKHIDGGKAPTLLLANDTCVLQHLWLICAFSPLFCTMDFDEKTGKAGVRPIGAIEMIRRACGINFP